MAWRAGFRSLKKSRRPHERAAGSQAGNKMRPPGRSPAARSPGRWCGNAPASWRHWNIGRHSRGAPGVPASLAGLADRPVGALAGVGPVDSYGAIGARFACVLRGNAGGHGQMHREPQRRSQHGEAMPVFPLVASSRVLPGVSSPRSRASRTIDAAARSFTLPPDLADSPWREGECLRVHGRPGPDGSKACLRYAVQAGSNRGGFSQR